VATRENPRTPLVHCHRIAAALAYMLHDAIKQDAESGDPR